MKTGVVFRTRGVGEVVLLPRWRTFRMCECRLQRILVDEPSRPSKQARAAERPTRLVSDVIEREADDVDVDVVVCSEGPRAGVGESGSGDSGMRNE